MSTNGDQHYTPVESLPVPEELKRRGGYRKPKNEKLCMYKTSSGTPCRAWRLRNSNFCAGHDYEWKEKQAQLNQARQLLARADDLGTAEGVHHLLATVVEDVRENRTPPNVANCLGFLAQLLMTNLERLEIERKANDPDDQNMVDLTKRFRQILADQLLETREKEIQRLGDHAYPMQAANADAAAVKKSIEDLARIVEASPDAKKKEKPSNGDSKRKTPDVSPGPNV